MNNRMKKLHSYFLSNVGWGEVQYNKKTARFGNKTYVAPNGKLLI
jgi:hypothetical protein